MRRRVLDPDSANAWRFSPFWDQIEVSDGILGSLDEGTDLDAAPRVVATDAEPEKLWLVEGGYRREVTDVGIRELVARSAADHDNAARRDPPVRVHGDLLT